VQKDEGRKKKENFEGGTLEHLCRRKCGEILKRVVMWADADLQAQMRMWTQTLASRTSKTSKDCSFYSKINKGRSPVW
jgi:hypothetical protein